MPEKPGGGGSGETSGARNPLQEARQKLFPPLRNRVLARAAGAIADGRIELAEKLVVGFLARTPNEPDALNLAAEIARRKQNFEVAEELMARCVAARPDFPGYRFNHAIILRRLHKHERALEQLELLLSKVPHHVLYNSQKAELLTLMGRPMDAVACRRALVGDHPDFAEGWFEYGMALRNAGLLDECVAALRKAIEIDPGFEAAYSRLADLKTRRFSEEEIAWMEGRITRGALSVRARADLHLALGKAYGDRKCYAKSFENYARSNALRQLGADFDAGRLTVYRRNCERLFTEAFFRERAGSGLDSSAPIFIVGMPRSGTTLVEQILSCHSAIEGLGELPDLDDIVGRHLSAFDEKRPAHEFWISGWLEFRSGLVEVFPQFLETLDAPEMRRIGNEYISLTQERRKSERPYFTDKALRNFGHIGLVHLVLPQAKIIDVRRHPLDCGWSCFRSLFPGGQPFANRLADIGSHYANYVRLMAHFDRVLPGRIYPVIYENLVADPEGEIARLLECLSLPFESQCLRFHENTRSVDTLSHEQVRIPLYTSGVGQWRPYEQWLGPLKAALGPVLDAYPNPPQPQ